MSPQLQWLGTLPEERNYLAEALSKGVEAFTGAREAKRERALEFEKISYTKKKQAADLIIKQIDYATPQQKEQLIGEGSKPGALVLDVYGEEALNTLRGVSGRGKADKIAKVETWIKTGKKQAFGFPVSLTKESMDTSISLELNDADWKTTYPDIAKDFEASFAAKKQPKRDDGVRWPWGKKTDYRGMTEQELFVKAIAGDKEAISEATRRGYPVGGR